MSKQLLKSDQMAAGTLSRGEYPASDMTIRERYAMAAMQGMLANGTAFSVNPNEDDKMISQKAFSISDSMVFEGNKYGNY